MRSRVHRFLFPSLASLTVVALAFACGTEDVTIPDPTPPIGTGQDSAIDSKVPDATVADTAPDGPPVVCPDVLPDDATGVYVAPGGTTNVACGTRASPCKTITLGVTHAVAASRPKVYVTRGTYVERVALAAGVDIVGGWDVAAGSTTWKRACTNPERLVVVRAPAGQNITVSATDLGGAAGLSLLRVESKVAAQVAAGESLYGVMAVGATTTLAMTDVEIEVANAGAGANVPKAAAGAAGAPSCPAGGGTPGLPGGQGAGAGIGSFAPTGYQPALGAAGTVGAPGDNGTPGGIGTCVTCGTCSFVTGCVFMPDVGPQSCGKDGVPGCGGGPAAAGGAASGGGSSIGLFAWDATVTIKGGSIKSGDAGNGGSGGAGGNGGAPTNGAVGTPAALCVTSCALGAGVCIETQTRGMGGAAGGPGGLGGGGGAGGGGGGGSSFGLYQGGAGLVTTESTKILHGKAGTGGGPGAGAGAAGAAAPRVP
jgi:hypothetical protein